ncbi:MAG: mannose-1-phosphate guanyltransferase [Actinomycetota bacterium]
MKAVIMAGGEGTRLRPLTANQPKPMLPVVNRPLMQHVVALLSRHDYKDLVVTVQFLANLVRNYFGDGSDMGVHLTYATEVTPLGTAGSVKNAQEQLDSTFLVVSGDALTDIDLEELVSFHREKGAMVTVALKRVQNPLEFGIVITRKDGSVERFLEKPNWGQVFSDTVNTGIYVIEPGVFDFIAEGESVDFSQDVFPQLLAKGLPVFGFVADGYWEDVGNLAAYMRAHQDVLDGKVRVEVGGFEVRPGVWVGQGADVDPDARLDGPVVIGDYAKVEAGAHLREYTVIGNNVVVKSGAFLHRAIVQDNAYVGAIANLRGCVIGRNADIKSGSRVEDGVVVGDGSVIGEGAILQSHVKVYPLKMVEAGAIVTKSLIWESRGARTLFGERGVRGLTNVDLTPEIVLRLAMAYGTILPRGAAVVLSRDESRVARAVKRALIAGLSATGVVCRDLEIAPTPVARFAARTTSAAGGVAVRTAPGDRESLEIQIFGPDGIDLDDVLRRKVERTFYREDFRRAFGTEIGELSYPPRATELYTSGLLAAIDAQAIREWNPKIVIDAEFGSSTLVLPRILGKLGAETLLVSGYLDEARAALSVEEQRLGLTRLAEMVQSSGADLGAAIDPVGERLFLADGAGRLVSGESALLALTELATKQTGTGWVAAPICTTRVIGDLARRNGCEVEFTKVSRSALMSTAAKPGCVSAGEEMGGLMVPAFLPAFDAIAALVRLLELLARGGRDVGELVSALPAGHVVHRQVPTAWEDKGAVMRQLMEHVKGREVDLTDGVKAFHGSDWALVLPDVEDPVIHVWAEGGDREASLEIIEEYVAVVKGSSR